MADNKDILSEQINENFSVEWLEEDKIATFKVNSIKPHVIDTWADKVKEVMLAWPSNKILLTLHDYSATKNFVTTSHLRRRSKENTQLRSDLDARTAVVMPDSFVIRMTSVLLRALPQPKKTSRQRRIFTSRAEALAWLSEALDET